jgi:hypothetical protein
VKAEIVGKRGREGIWSGSRGAMCSRKGTGTTQGDKKLRRRMKMYCTLRWFRRGANRNLWSGTVKRASIPKTM